MRALRQRLGREDGQTLVLFVVIITALVVLLAFVVDVGSWLATKHKLQTVADGAALAAVPWLPDQATAGAKANEYLTHQDMSDVTLEFPPPQDSTTFTVTASHEAPIIFGGAAGIPGFTLKVTATAALAPASTLNNDKLTQVVPAPPPYIAPIVVKQCAVAQTCLSGPCSGPPGCDLNYDALDPTASDSLFGIANLGGSSSTSAFSEWVACNPCVGGNIGAGSSYAQLTAGVSGIQPGGPVEAMNQTIGRRLILPVFDTFDGSAYHIVGFTAFVVTTTQFDGTQPAGNWQAESPLCSPNCKVIHGYFTDYNLPASYGSAGGGTGQDFGVRAIGLTS